MSDEATLELSIRSQVKAATPEEFAKAHSKAELQDTAATVGIAIEDLKGTKAEITALIYAKFPLPDPALRGKSTDASPVCGVWAFAERAFTVARENEGTNPRRKDVVAACVEKGIAFYTARTQYQAWYKRTDAGAIPITAGMDGLPKGLLVELGLEVPEEAPTDES